MKEESFNALQKKREREENDDSQNDERKSLRKGSQNLDCR